MKRLPLQEPQSELNDSLKLAGYRNVTVVELPKDVFFSTIDELPHEKKLIIGCDFVNVKDVLGQEFELVSVFVDNSLSPNLLFAAVGTLVSGGDFVVCTENGMTLNTFYSQVLKELTSIQEKINTQTGEYWKTAVDERVQVKESNTLKELKEFFFKHKKIALLAPRGYGKSTLLGKFGAFLIDSNKTVSVVSSSKKACAQALSGLTSDDFCFSPTENLGEVKENCVYLVDEAANCSQHHITGLLERSDGFVLSTTVEGYEGQGVGFKYFLERNNVPVFHLAHCWRNSCDDFLFKWQQKYNLNSFSSTLLLKSDLQLKNVDDECLMVRLESLPTNLWREAFYLLSQSHYRTSPNDLCQLTSNDCRYIVATISGKLVGLIVYQYEQLDTDILEEITYCTRRPPGNALLQSLLVSSALLELGGITGVRVLRIVVNSMLHMKGIGRKMLSFLEQGEDSVDLLGAMFSLQESTGTFWGKCNYTLVNKGIRKSPWLATSSCTVVKSLSGKGLKVLSLLECTFYARKYFYENDYALLFHVEHNRNQPNPTTEFVCFAICATIDGYRDIMFLLPVLTSYIKLDERNHDPLRGVVEVFLKTALISDIVNLTTSKSEKKRITHELRDALLESNLLLFVREKKQDYATLQCIMTSCHVK